MKKFLLLTFGVFLVGIGVSLALKADIGVGAWDALSQSICSIVPIKIGTFSMMMNISCVLGQIIILKRKFNPINILQIGVAITLGTIVNFLLYDILYDFNVNSYLIKVVMILIGYLLCALGVSIVMALKLISLPLEALCEVLATKIPLGFGKIRQAVDIISILLVLLLAFGFSAELSIREGTVLGMLIFGPLLDIFIKKLEPIFDKL